MLTAVEITNTRGDTLRLPLADSANGYSVRDIEGLDPVNATLTTSTIAQDDGAQPQNARRDSRNVTMKLGLEPDYMMSTVASLRSGLYDYLMPKANITLGFYVDGSLFVTSQGQVESFENSMFSADPEVDISIICYKPDFFGVAPQVLSSSSRADTNTNIVDYPGTSPTGMIFTLNVDRTLNDFTVVSTTPSGVRQRMSVSGAFVAGDIVTITTIPGQKSVILTRGRGISSVLNYLSTPAQWISLEKGDNAFGVFTATAGVPYTMTYTPLYGGI